MCRCLHYNPMKCAAQRFNASPTLIECLQAMCRCTCHVKGEHSTPVHRDQWRPLSAALPVKPAIPSGAPRQSNRAQLTPEQVVEIRQLAITQTRYQLAERYNVSYDAIS